MKKLAIFLSVMALCGTCFAQDVIDYDTQTGFVTRYLHSVSGFSDGIGRIAYSAPNDSMDSTTQQIMGERRDAIQSLKDSSVPFRYWKISNGLPVEMSQAEKDALDQAQIDAGIASIRTSAKSKLDNFYDESLFLRAFADILKDEINTLREWTVSFKAEVASASNLADLKARVATLPDLDDRNLAQLKTAIQNRIDSGDVD